MPFLALELKCSMVNVDNLRVQEPESFRWHIKVKCTNCGETPENWHYVVIDEMIEVPGSKGEAHLVEKCKLCNRINTLKIIPETLGSYKQDKNEKFQPIITFDCRGIEPFDFDPRNGWIAEGTETGTVFEDIDLTEATWADYDEKANEATEINDVVIQFSHSKIKK